MNDHTIRSMYTKRAPGGINNLCMNDLNTTQELSIIEKQRLANRLSYQRNKEKRKKACLDNYYKNKDSRVLKAKQYYSENREKHLLTCRLHWEQNKEKYRTNAKQWYYNNKKRAYERDRERAKTDPQYKLAKTQRTRISDALRTQKAIKNQTTLTLLGCTFEELKQHLESLWLPGMSWENYSYRGWHVDHIRPCNTFSLSDPAQQHQCFHYTNLRPLWAADNLSRPNNGSDLK